MSSESLPISGPRFAEALKDLSLASLHLKTLEIRNSLAHLAYSNAQLRPFAEGALPTLDTAATANETTNAYQPDPDCVEAIRENEVVMQRMHERIDLVRAEVEGRGVSWREFESPEEMEDTEPGVDQSTGGNGEARSGSLPLTNGVNGPAVQETASSTPNNNTSARSGGNPWTDGTFQTGVIRNGQVHMDAVPEHQRSGGDGEATNAATTTAPTTAAPMPNTGGRLTDEDLRRLLEQRLDEDDDNGDEADGGLHL